MKASFRVERLLIPDRRRAVFRGLMGVLLVGGIGIVGIDRHRRSPTISVLPPSTRRAMPAFSLPLLSGEVWRLQDHRERVILLNLWATWCLPCRRELPLLSELARDQKSRGLDVVGVDVDTGDRRRKTMEFLRTSPVSYPIAIPEQMPQIGPEVEAIPTTFLIDREGRIAVILVGAFDKDALRRAVTELLQER